MAKTTERYAWRFFRAGGVDQVDLRGAADLDRLAELDLALWIALSCPVKGLDVDERTLALVDGDHDGRIRPPEVLAAIAWSKDAFADLAVLFDGGGDALPLASVRKSSDAGKRVLAGAKRVLEGRGKPDAKSITLADVADTEALFAGLRLNGDGVVPPEAAEDADVRVAIEDAIAAVGSKPDRSGKPGVDAELATRFFDEAAALAAWRAKAAADPALVPLGEATADAFATLVAVEAKVEDWFARCRLAAFDPRAGALLCGAEADLAALAARDLSREADAIAALPIARVEPGRALPLGDGANPAWRARLRALAEGVVAPLIGPRDALTEAEWSTIVDRFAAHRAWAKDKPTTSLDALPAARVEALAPLRDRVLALVAEDAALAPELAEIEAVERALRYRRDLVRLLRNFVSFSDFYARKGAAFQVGTLYLDGRACELCVLVEDAGKHAALAGLAKSYLVYCDATRPGAEKMGFVAVVTGGSTDNLLVGRNGVFYDRKGRDWDAKVTKIVENPISVRQAFFAPYERFVRLVEEQLAKRAAAAETESTSHVDAAAAATAAAPAHPDAAKPDDKAAPKPSRFDVGTVAAIGVAVGGLATFLSSVVATFLGLGMWMPFGLAALLLAISGPSMLIAWLKLRQRNLGPILDAGGWAINGRARINVPFGASLTRLAALPQGAERSLADPFAEKERPVRRWVVAATLLLVALLWFFGKLDAYLPDKVRASVVLHRTPVVTSDR